MFIIMQCTTIGSNFHQFVSSRDLCLHDNGQRGRSHLTVECTRSFIWLVFINYSLDIVNLFEGREINICYLIMLDLHQSYTRSRNRKVTSAFVFKS